MDGALPVVRRIVNWSFGVVGLPGHLLVGDARAERVGARGRPALPRCADAESGDKMIDRVLLP
jgi:hypothetical protein